MLDLILPFLKILMSLVEFSLCEVSNYLVSFHFLISFNDVCLYFTVLLVGHDM